VRLLLDTPALLWWLAADDHLSAKARKTITDPDNVIFVSAASGWEISLNRSLGRVEVSFEALVDAIDEGGFEMLPVSLQHGLIAGQHGLIAGALPAHHRDPFDRMLVAQCQAEGLRLVSSDRQLAAYGVDLLW